jgi:GNAT superfamily N-acetyltransferase
MDTDIEDLSSSGFVAPLRDILVACWSELFSGLPGVAIHQEQGVFGFQTEIRHDEFNRGLHTDQELALASANIETRIRHLQRRHMPFLWHVGISASSSFPDTRSTIEGFGLTHYETEPVMAIDLFGMGEDMGVTASLEIQPVSTDELLGHWIRVVESGSAEDVINLWQECYATLCFKAQTPLHLFLGTVDGKPVATSEVYLGRRVAFIGAVNTLSQYRRQGIGTAITLMALHQAQRQGYRIAVLTASPMGEPIYRRLGFQEFDGTFSTYLWHPLYGNR